MILLFDLFECGKKGLVKFCLRIVNFYQFQPILNRFSQIPWNLIIITDKAIKAKQNDYKRLAEQTIITTEKCHFWQHDPVIGASLSSMTIRR